MTHHDIRASHHSRTSLSRPLTCLPFREWLPRRLPCLGIISHSVTRRRFHPHSMRRCERIQITAHERTLMVASTLALPACLDRPAGLPMWRAFLAVPPTTDLNFLTVNPCIWPNALGTYSRFAYDLHDHGSLCMRRTYFSCCTFSSRRIFYAHNRTLPRSPRGRHVSCRRNKPRVPTLEILPVQTPKEKAISAQRHSRATSKGWQWICTRGLRVCGQSSAVG